MSELNLIFLNFNLLPVMLETSRNAGALMSGAASKAVEYCCHFRTSPAGAPT
jgi:hypothetical protein